MQQLVGPETFEFLAKFFLAGWLFLSARSWWVRGERPRPNEVIFEAITLSLINQLLALLTIPLLAAALEPENELIVLLAEVFVQPVSLGIVVGWLAERNWFPDGLRRLLMPSVKPVTQAYEFAFQANQKPSFVIVAFADGREVYGYFGEDSIAGKDGANSGIYLERLYFVDNEETWHEVSPSRSAWLSLDSVRSIEFLQEES